MNVDQLIEKLTELRDEAGSCLPVFISIPERFSSHTVKMWAGDPLCLVDKIEYIFLGQNDEVIISIEKG